MKGEGRKRVKNGVQRILMKGGKGKEKGNEGGRRILKVGLRGGGGGGARTLPRINRNTSSVIPLYS